MAVLNPEHPLEQAEKLIVQLTPGALRQVDLRRAISSAYYAVFHFILTTAADEFVGTTKRSGMAYTLVYRSVDHRALRDLCVEVKKPTLTARYSKHAPANGFGVNLHGFANAVTDLQEKRHSADYDPSIQITRSDVRLAIATARSAIRRFKKAGPRRRNAFLTLLLFPPR